MKLYHCPAGTAASRGRIPSSADHPAQGIKQDPQQQWGQQGSALAAQWSCPECHSRVLSAAREALVLYQLLLMYHDFIITISHYTAAGLGKAEKCKPAA